MRTVTSCHYHPVVPPPLLVPIPSSLLHVCPCSVHVCICACACVSIPHRAQPFTRDLGYSHILSAPPQSNFLVGFERPQQQLRKNGTKATVDSLLGTSSSSPQGGQRSTSAIVPRVPSNIGIWDSPLKTAWKVRVFPVSSSTGIASLHHTQLFTWEPRIDTVGTVPTEPYQSLLFVSFQGVCLRWSLILSPRLITNPKPGPSFCLSFPYAGIMGVCICNG